MPKAVKVLPRPTSSAATTRPTTSARGYGYAHQRQRARLLKVYPVCQRCNDQWSSHLHHRDRNPFNRADANAEMLCERCHQAEHTS